MNKKTNPLTSVPATLFAVVLLAIGILIGRASYEPRAVALNIRDEKDSSLALTHVQNIVTVSGQAKIKIKSEIALISLGIEICDPEANRANLQVNQKLASLTTGLHAAGLPKESIIPTDFSLYPRTDYNTSKLSGFCATNRLEVTTTELDKVSGYLDKAIESGATNIYGVTFKSKDTSEVRQAGIRLAFEDAERQAQTAAKLMHLSIQRIAKSDIEMSGTWVDAAVGYHGGGGSVPPQDGDLQIKVVNVYELAK